jgi:hypothetical protein
MLYLLFVISYTRIKRNPKISLLILNFKVKLLEVKHKKLLLTLKTTKIAVLESYIKMLRREN